MTRRSRVIAYGSAGLLVVVGVASGVAMGGTFGQVLALVLVGLGLVLATALVFYEVGLSEDRERAREAAEAERAARLTKERQATPPRQARQRFRLQRRRGERRRLG